MPMAVPRKGVPPYREAESAMDAVSTAAHPSPAFEGRVWGIGQLSQLAEAQEAVVSAHGRGPPKTAAVDAADAGVAKKLFVR